jgi:hypothetical protein
MLRRLTVALFVVLFLFAAQPIRADDPGYFLSWKQKKQLLWVGRIQDSTGNWYDVWICPGYLPPAQYSWRHFKKTGADLHEYVEANKYRSLKEGSKACLNWAFKDCGLGFTVHGIPRAWGKHFSVAHERSQRRVFGWWMAYPWALLESSLETVFRGALGSAGTIGGTVSGIAIVPAYHALDSAIVGVWDLGVNTIILPAVGITWNTVVGPPLALIGQKPAESRVDGFWVVEIPAVQPAARPLNPGETAALGRWGLLLLKVSRPFIEDRRQNDENCRLKKEELSRQIQQLDQEIHRKRNASLANQRAEIQQAGSQPDTEKEFSDLAVAFSPRGECESQVRAYLRDERIPNGDIEEIMRLLREYPSPRLLISTNPVAPGAVRGKTDPLKRSADILGDAVDDKVEEMINP